MFRVAVSGFGLRVRIYGFRVSESLHGGSRLCRNMVPGRVLVNIRP